MAVFGVIDRCRTSAEDIDPFIVETGGEVVGNLSTNREDDTMGDSSSRISITRSNVSSSK